MLKKISFLIAKSENNLIQNQTYLFMLAVFNVCILMNFHKMIWKNPILIVITFIMVGLTLLNYRLWWTTIITTIVSFCHFSYNFPRLANHSNLEFFVEFFILGILLLKWHRPKIYINPNLVSSIFKVVLVTTYFYTGFHKLNSDFFFSEVSCIKAINQFVMNVFMGPDFVMPQPLIKFLQYATIFIESILPFGLFWQQTRKYTVFVLLFFHFYLSFTVFADFSSFAGFLLLGCCVDFEKNTLPEPLIKSLKWYVFFALVAVFIKPFLVKFGYSPIQVSFLHGFVFNIGWLILFFIYFKKRKEKKYTYNPKHTALLLSFVVVISFWALKAYIGLGNSANLTMFSNLLTEKSRSNHLLIDTKKTKLFDFEEDNLLVLNLHDTVANEKLEGFKLPVIEFKYKAKEWTDKYPNLKLDATVVYNNDTLQIDDLRKTKFIATKWWYKYVFFRKIQPEGPNECYW